MPRRKIPGGTPDSANVAPTIGSAPYDGPGGPVRGLLKQLSVKDNSKGVPMFKFVIEVLEPVDSAKAKHNGQSMWGQQNLSHESAGWVNGMLLGMGVSAADQRVFWKDGVSVEKPDANGNEKVISIGKFKIPAAGIPVVVQAKLGDPYTNPNTGDTRPGRMEPTSFLIGTGDAAEPEDAVEEEVGDLIEETAEEETEDEAEEDDPFDLRATELEELSNAGNRNALIRIAKGHGLTVLKSHDNEAIINAILDQEFGAAPEDGEAEEEVEEPEDEVEETAEPEPAPAAKAPARSAAKRSATTKPPF